MTPLVSINNNLPLQQVPRSHDRFATRNSASDSLPTHSRRSSATTTTTTTPKNCKKQQQRKRVHFNHEHNEIFTIITRNDYTDKEVHDCWFDWDDKGKMFKSFHRALKRMASGKEPKKNDTYRGLENFSEKNSNSDSIIHHCIDAVMDEQERQWREDHPDDVVILDWDRFRAVSLGVSTQNSVRAFKMAEFDACEAREAYIDMGNKGEDDDDDHDSSESDDYGDGSTSSEGGELPEIPQSLKESMDCTRCWHPRKLKSFMLG